MTKLYDLAVKVREYQNRNGETKAEWANVGVVMEGRDGGQFILLSRHFNPAGIPNPKDDSTVLLSCFTPRDDQDQRQGGGQQRHQGQGGQRQGSGNGRRAGDDLDDEIPF